jgi:hypothetical protein
MARQRIRARNNKKRIRKEPGMYRTNRFCPVLAALMFMKSRWDFPCTSRVLLFGLIVSLVPIVCVAQPYTITTIAGVGNGSSSPNGDGGPALKAVLSPIGVALDIPGNLYIADDDNSNVSLVRKIGLDGVISTVAGVTSLGVGYSGDGGPAVSAQLNGPYGIAVDAGGNLFIADRGNGVIRMISMSGTITTVAGGGLPSPPGVGDGGPATSAKLGSPEGLTVDSDGNLYIADTMNNRVRRVTPDGTITTVAGTGLTLRSFGAVLGDGGLATQAVVDSPSAVVVDPDGNLYIADRGNSRIRKVSTDGIITIVAGTGVPGYSGDGGPATSAMLYYPWGLGIDGSGTIYISDTYNSRIRIITPDGNINTIAGNGNQGADGDGGPALSATLIQPYGIAIGAGGAIYIADYYRIRVLTPIP